jgi:hypothetical protein
VPELRRSIIMSPGKRWSATVSAHTRVLLCLGFEGRILRGRPTGTWVNGAYAYAAADNWLPGGLPGPAELPERDAARELALRWLRAFGPGTSLDLQWWAGWTASTTRTALADAGAVPVALEGGGTGWLAPGDEQPADPVGPWVALLPGLDPTTMGWKERAWYLPVEAAHAFDRMGNAGPTIWVDGHVAGAWVQGPDGEIRTHPFRALPPRRAAEVQQRAADLAGMIGKTRFTVRFPSPVSTALHSGAPPPV